MLATEFIFPSHAKDLFLTSMASTLDELSQLYLAVSDPLLPSVSARCVSADHL